MSTDYDWSNHTPIDNTGRQYSIFKSAYKNIRFKLQVNSMYTVTQDDMANLVGIAYRLFGDVSYWRVIMEFNAINDAIDDVYPGLVLGIPSKSAVIDFLSQQAQAVSSNVTMSI